VRLACQSAPTFFGLTPEQKAPVVLEGVFALMYYAGFSYTEAFKLPVVYKRWFIERITKELNDSRGGSRALQHNSPETRELQGMQRNQTPSRLRRFT